MKQPPSLVSKATGGVALAGWAEVIQGGDTGYKKRRNFGATKPPPEPQEGFCVLPLGWEGGSQPCTCRVSSPRFRGRGDVGTLAGSGLEGSTEGTAKYLQK